MSLYMDGIFIGARTTLDRQQPSGRAVLVRVRDVAGLVSAQGGKTGDLAFSFLPQTIEQTVYDKIAAELANGLKEKGVDADVKVVEPSGFQDSTNPIWKPLAIGLAGVLVGSLAWKYLKKR